MQAGWAVWQNGAFRNETAMSARNVLARALQSPRAPAHPQRLAADAEHARELGLAVRVLEALDRLADVLLDGERPAAAGQGRRGAHQRQRRRHLGEIAPGERLALGEDHGALDHVLELAHIARPGMVFYERRKFGVEAADALAEPARVVLGELPCEEQRIAPALAQRRQLDRNHGHPAIEVL